MNEENTQQDNNTINNIDTNSIQNNSQKCRLFLESSV